jgi:hypothetical protein
VDIAIVSWRSWPSPAPACPTRRRARAVVLTALGVLVALTVAELRRLLARLVWRPPVDPAFTIVWSLWRRRHQATARRAPTSNNAQNCDCRTKWTFRNRSTSQRASPLRLGWPCL